MERPQFDELASLLQRADVLFACREGPVDRTTIAELADCSRATAYRATADLEERGYVEQREGGYRLTALGSATVGNIRHLQMGVSGVRHIAPVLEHVDAAGFVDAVHEFGDAEVLEATPSAPDRVDRRLHSLVDETETRLLAMTSSSSAAVATTRCCERVDSAVDVSHVLTPTALAGVRAHYRPADGERSTPEETSMFRFDEIPVDLLIFDDTVVLPGADEESGTLTSMAIIRKSKVLNWAHTHIVWRRDNGMRLTEPSSRN